ncbi:MAG: ribosome silencing factor [Bacteroidetes bacterium]|nr:ribosome silencing factor [Bacteroidota bacterium]
MSNQVGNQNLILLKESIIKGMLDKKGHQVTSIDLSTLSYNISDMFILCHGNSDKQVETIAKNIEEEVFKATGEKACHKEGYANKEWILLDYFDIIVHVFEEEKREFYALEKLWGDGEVQVYNSDK